MKIQLSVLTRRCYPGEDLTKRPPKEKAPEGELGAAKPAVRGVAKGGVFSPL